MPKPVFSPKYKYFCMLLIEARKANGLTQEDVANSLKRQQSFVSKYENGERRLDVVEFLEIAKIIGIAPQSIVEKIQAFHHQK